MNSGLFTFGEFRDKKRPADAGQMSHDGQVVAGSSHFGSQSP
ncbi:hypothetical protein ECMP0209401_0471 [Escherichia coli MP020940.1]|nr:hypothetical protein CSC23_1875 [Escherichia coli]EDU62857.1 hypothetical protein Ec53638_0981 [Escherichia coli 53638]EHU87528.1 hypothetical protein ECDEC4A_4554 [Escherichia coli DEC4A]EMX60410.1 hypothetical protein ECMP0209401_0471 [Escherichia coli MP020940.1]EMZ99301.1 hypothetical protein ECP03048161_0148 [Escherichia coli P0304816.1]ENH39275.1 hypothetical protein ECP03048163_0280 [Escherichia coli P0304816.3]KDU00381.1 hypothetical protein AC33_1461 [Escherichia coli 3-267-03_S3_